MDLPVEAPLGFPVEAHLGCPVEDQPGLPTGTHLGCPAEAQGGLSGKTHMGLLVEAHMSLPVEAQLGPLVDAQMDLPVEAPSGLPVEDQPGLPTEVHLGPLGDARTVPPTSTMRTTLQAGPASMAPPAEAVRAALDMVMPAAPERVIPLAISARVILNASAVMTISSMATGTIEWPTPTEAHRHIDSLEIIEQGPPPSLKTSDLGIETLGPVETMHELAPKGLPALVFKARPRLGDKGRFAENRMMSLVTPSEVTLESRVPNLLPSKRRKKRSKRKIKDTQIMGEPRHGASDADIHNVLVQTEPTRTPIEAGTLPTPPNMTFPEPPRTWAQRVLTHTTPPPRPSRDFLAPVYDTTIPDRRYTTDEQGRRILLYARDEGSRLAQPFQYSLVGRFTTKRPTLEDIEKTYLAPGNFHGRVAIGALNFSSIFIRFELEMDYRHAWSRPTWTIGDSVLHTHRWTPDTRHAPHTTPIWVGFPGLRRVYLYPWPMRWELLYP